MNSAELRKKFLDFFESKDHAIVPSSSLISDDPSVLLTTAGMQQFKPYFIGTKDSLEDFGSTNTASVQKSFRTSDIEEVGDESHLTFFEMLGNFSFGGYFKEVAIRCAHEFITKELKLSISYVTIFEGNDEVPKDKTSADFWSSIDKDIEIRSAGVSDNFWGPTGSEGPCGPTTEIYVRNANGQDTEIWNLVFNEYYFSGTREELLSGLSDKKLRPLNTPGVDTGMGLERLAMVSQGTKTVFETDLFVPLAHLLPAKFDTRNSRIIMDHARAVTFLISDGVLPENKGAGYVLRRLMRRLIVMDTPFTELCAAIVHTYSAHYKELNESKAIEVYKSEKEKFGNSMQKGLEKLKGMKTLGAKEAFDLYQTFGLPYEVLMDQSIATFTKEEFNEHFTAHQDISRKGAGHKFKGGLADKSDAVVKLHTATHLLNAALRTVLGQNVWQKGSNITSERTRFDFTHPEKLSREQVQQVEELVNEWIKRDLDVTREEMSRDEAENLGAVGVFGEKYPDIVSVYTIKDGSTDEIISREFCGGPHTQRTGLLGHFNIEKEESSSAGVRRIKATLSE